MNEIVDAWMQHPTRRHLTNKIFHSIHRWNKTPLKLLEDDAFPMYDLETSVNSMNAGRVRVGLICSWYSADICLISNEEVEEVINQFPGRFRGIASADVRNPVKAVREIRKFVVEKNFVGVRMIPWLWEKFANDALFYPIYAECAQLNVPFCLQVGQTGPLRPSEFGKPIPYLERVLLDFPELKIVAGHIGSPWMDEMIFLCHKFPNLYIDTSAYVPDRYPKKLVQFMKSKKGKKRVLFGSNYPMIQHAVIYEQLDGLNLDEETRRLFLYENAERVFNLKAVDGIRSKL